MNIIDETKELKYSTVKFRDVKRGEVFLPIDEKEVYIKTEDISVYGHTGLFNSINLVDGLVGFFDNDEVVYIVNCRLSYSLVLGEE